MITKGNHAHYEKGIEAVLRKSNINYIGTNESKKGLQKDGSKLKNFDVLINSKNTFILDIKGKQFGYPGAMANKWENWLATNHVTDLIKWKAVFKASKCNVKPLLVFLFKLSCPEDQIFFKDIYSFKGNWYGAVAIEPDVYWKNSKPRAKNIICVSRKEFKELVKPLSYYIPEIRYN
jgi:hypothetical protein